MDLRRIEIECNSDLGSDHTEITLQGTAGQHLDESDPQSIREVWRANVDVAGIIGRVGVFAASWAAASAVNHGCGTRPERFGDDAFSPPLLEGCCVGGVEELLRPGGDLGSSPCAWITVPTKELDGWLALIRTWLEAIANDVNALNSLDDLENHDEPTTTTDHSDLPSDGYPPRVLENAPTPMDPWIAGGDCDHLARGLDRAPVTKILRCQDCRKHERAQAIARERRGAA